MTKEDIGLTVFLGKKENVNSVYFYPDNKVFSEILHSFTIKIGHKLI